MAFRRDSILILVTVEKCPSKFCCLFRKKKTNLMHVQKFPYPMHQSVKKLPRKEKLTYIYEPKKVKRSKLFTRLSRCKITAFPLNSHCGTLWIRTQHQYRQPLLSLKLLAIFEGTSPFEYFLRKRTEHHCCICTVLDYRELPAENENSLNLHGCVYTAIFSCSHSICLHCIRKPVSQPDLC